MSARALNDDDVSREMKILVKIDGKKMNSILDKYTNALKSIISMIIEKTDDEEEQVNAERIKRIITIVPVAELFIRTKDKVWSAREHIMKRNASYFLEKDYSSLIKKDKNQAFIENVVEMVQDRFDSVDEKELEFYWKQSQRMLLCIAHFRKEKEKISKKSE